jgi:WD repeat and SOF domain-containing protein 1
MVKIKAICRDENEYKRNTNTEIEKVFRNPNPRLHPFQKAKEYVRALNAAKLEKMFAKPFLFSLNNHTDGVKCLAKNRTNLTEVVSGSFDGQIILWNVNDKRPNFNINSSHNFVKGLCFSNTGEEFLSCGDDNSIHIYNKASLVSQRQNFINETISIMDNSAELSSHPYQPAAVYQTDLFLENIDHSYNEKIFATSGGVVSIWNYERNSPTQQFNTSTDGFIKVKFNYVENHILLATGYDRTISLFDLRTHNPLKSVSLKNKSSAACWNPQEPFNFTVGNEDSNCYTFDMRKLDTIKMIHKDHILAVLDLDYSPTGKEFVTGSFDKTVRIFKITDGTSRECYHTKRMQKYVIIYFYFYFVRVYSVLYTMDDRYVLSGSDDTNIRFWKASANDPIKLVNISVYYFLL